MAKKTLQTVYWESIESERGECIVMATEQGVCWAGAPGAPVDEGVNWVRRKMDAGGIKRDAKAQPLQQTLEELQRYLAGERIQFSCMLDLAGTEFQIATWQAMFRIPYGETRSYQEIAWAIRRPAAVRAVGQACGANPVAIIVPCHRVIGSNGKLIGYGRGVPTKAWLLALEREAEKRAAQQGMAEPVLGSIRHLAHQER